MCAFLDGAVALFFLVALVIYAVEWRKMKPFSAFWKLSVTAIAVFLAIQTTTFTMRAFVPESAAYATYERTVLYYGAVLQLGLMWDVCLMLRFERFSGSMKGSWAETMPGLSLLNIAIISVYLTLSAAYSTNADFLQVRAIVLTW